MPPLSQFYKKYSSILAITNFDFKYYETIRFNNPDTLDTLPCASL
jgi:hypothetical protein